MAALDRARTALSGLVAGRIAFTGSDTELTSAQALRDVRAFSLLVLAATFALAIASAALTAASAVLDRRATYALLRLIGTPLRTLDRARALETALPLAVGATAAVTAGALSSAPLVLARPTEFSGGSLLIILAAAFAGVVCVLGAGALSRPLLRHVTENPTRRGD
ncbi:MAG: FtsX-like permease family protein [Solirubrobacteraceae bacterium]